MRKTTIGEKIDGFIAYKRSLGYVYDTAERYLKHYQRHMEERYPHLDLPDKESTDCFLDQYKGQAGGLYLSLIHIFKGSQVQILSSRPEEKKRLGSLAG